MRLAKKVYTLLKQKGLKVATAESCTGGMLASSLVGVPGASDIIDMSFVTYSYDAKCNILGVSMDTINTYNVVSEEVAREMVTGASKVSGAKVALSTTGVAGPTGGTKERPVGMVCFGILYNDKIYTYTHKFWNISRTYIRKASVRFCLKKLLALLKDN